MSNFQVDMCPLPALSSDGTPRPMGVSQRGVVVLNLFWKLYPPNYWTDSTIQNNVVIQRVHIRHTFQQEVSSLTQLVRGISKPYSSPLSCEQLKKKQTSIWCQWTQSDSFNELVED